MLSVELFAADLGHPSVVNRESRALKELAYPPIKSKPNLMVMRSNLSIKVGGVAELSTRHVDYSCTVRNVNDKLKQLTLAQPAAPKDKRELKLNAKASKTEVFRGNIQISPLSPVTHQATLRPYLLGIENKTDEKLLMAKYDADLLIRLPKNARLIKSSVVMNKVNDTEYKWKVSQAPILPPIHLWYTTAGENIKADMHISKGKNVVVTINVTNEAATAVQGLKLLTRFPAGSFEPVVNESDGQFNLEQNVMYIWNGRVDSLNAKKTTSMKLTLRNISNDEYPKIQEVAIHNKNGDLIAIGEVKK